MARKPQIRFAFARGVPTRPVLVKGWSRRPQEEFCSVTSVSSNKHAGWIEQLPFKTTRIEGGVHSPSTGSGQERGYTQSRE
jgi:hypothetical protein